MVSESGEDLELGPYFYRADGPCFRCSFPQFRQLTPSRQYRVSAPIALHLQIGFVATEIIYLSTRIGSASRAGEVRYYKEDLQLVGSSRCVFVPGCARCRPMPRALRGDTEAKIDTAIVFEDYISLRSRADSSAGHKNTVLGGVAHNHSGWDDARVAKAWDQLMKRLGYERYGAHGGDAGALVSRELGILKPDGLVGVHVLQIFAFPSGDSAEMEGLSEYDREALQILSGFEDRAGYLKIQQTRPQTLAYGLTDSPAGQLAWNSELFMGFGGGGVGVVDRDRFLTHVMFYWLTATAGSSAREYYEDARTGAGYRELPNTVPIGVAVFKNDFHTIRRFAERANNIVH
jgi:hypothetical protein